MTLDLSAFCNPNWYPGTAPWTAASYRYATNNVVCVRVPAPGEPDAVPDGQYPPNAAGLFAEAALSGEERWPWPATHEGRCDMLECPGPDGEDCFGGRRGKQCPRCRGDGWQCQHCDETGFVRGRRPCKECGGTGKVPGAVDLGPCRLMYRHYALVRGLPGPVTFGRTALANCWRFEFASGEGLFMQVEEHDSEP